MVVVVVAGVTAVVAAREVAAVTAAEVASSLEAFAAALASSMTPRRYFWAGKVSWSDSRFVSANALGAIRLVRQKLVPIRGRGIAASRSTSLLHSIGKNVGIIVCVKLARISQQFIRYRHLEWIWQWLQKQAWRHGLSQIRRCLGSQSHVVISG